MNHRVWLVTLVVALVLLDVVLLVWARDSPAPPESVQGSAENSVTPEPSLGPRDDNQQESRPAREIDLRVATATAQPGEPVAVRGRVAEGFPGTRLVIQRRLDGNWMDFPLPTVVHSSGRFATHIQLTEPGRYRVRIADPITRTKSNTVPIRIVAAANN